MNFGQQLRQLGRKMIELADAYDREADRQPGRANRKSRRVPEISDREYTDRWQLWNVYWRLKCEEVSGQVFDKRKGQSVPTSQLFFAVKMGVNPSELSRWLKRRGIASGSIPDTSIRRALDGEIERLNLVLSQRTEKIPIGR